MRSYRFAIATSAVAVILGWPSSLWAQAIAPNLGAAAPFAVLGTNPTPTIATVACSDTGPGTGITGQVGTTFPGGITNVACTVPGPIVAPVAGGVVTDFNAARSQIDLQNSVCTGVIPIVSTVLTPGVYCSAAGTTIAAGVTLTLSGNATDVWVFRVGTAGPGALTITGGSVVMGGAARACNVFWKTSAATTFTDVSQFNGTVISGAAITMTRTNWIGRALASTDVTLVDPMPMTFAGCTAGAQPVGCPATSIAPLVINNGSVGSAFNQTFTQTGSAVGGSVFTTVPGTLPPGLTLSGGGVLSGTPTTARPDTFTVRGADTNGCFAVRTFTVVITDSGTNPPQAGCPLITLSPTTIPNGAVGVAYDQAITAVGAVTAVTFTRTAGDLPPPGLTLSSTGTISGTPTGISSTNFTIRATQTNGCFAELPFGISILAGVPTLPQLFVWLLALTLIYLGYRQLRRRDEHQTIA